MPDPVSEERVREDPLQERGIDNWPDAWPTDLFVDLGDMRFVVRDGERLRMRAAKGWNHAWDELKIDGLERVLDTALRELLALRQQVEEAEGRAQNFALMLRRVARQLPDTKEELYRAAVDLIQRLDPHGALRGTDSAPAPSAAPKLPDDWHLEPTDNSSSLCYLVGASDTGFVDVYDNGEGMTVAASNAPPAAIRCALAKAEEVSRG